ncbi:MAG: exopolysaccharide biosynthesis protein, partial [Terrimicrobiaceae bacterium]
PRRVTDDLRGILELADGHSLPLANILKYTRGRGLQIIAIILCLPFLSPVSIPGLSIPFGLAIGICGLRIAFRHQPWLPEFLANRRISFVVLEKMLRFGIGIHTKLEKFLRARWPALVESHAAQMGAGLTITLCAFLLSLPIPPPFPFTNTIPGFAIILLSLGLLEQDGLVIFAGYLLSALAVVYVAVIAFLGGAGAAQIWHWLWSFI